VLKRGKADQLNDYCIILNPAARAVRRREVVSQLPTVARGACVRLTARPGHATELAKNAVREGFKTIIAAGGDGTVNEVLRGMVGSSARLGVLPLGTMNVFARELRLPLDWEEAWHRVRTGSSRHVDLGWANDVPVAQLAGVGFDAEVVRSVSAAAKERFGPLAYAWEAMRRMGGSLPRLKVETAEFETAQAVWVLVGLGRLYGGPFPVFPKGNNTNGLLDVIVVENLTYKQLPSIFSRLMSGTHAALPGLRYFQTESLCVREALSRRGGPSMSEPALEVDGEWRGRAAVRFGVTPGGLCVVA
jgi:diacylglycerol kinase (ATP)